VDWRTEESKGVIGWVVVRLLRQGAFITGIIWSVSYVKAVVLWNGQECKGGQRQFRLGIVGTVE